LVKVRRKNSVPIFLGYLVRETSSLRCFYTAGNSLEVKV